MTKTAATSYEARWRKNSDPVDQWFSPVTVGSDGHVSVPGLERVSDYTFEARAVSACGAKSAWATQTFNLPDVPAGTLTLAYLDNEVTNASAGAAAANAELANIANDNILSPAEKPTVMRDYSVITTEQAGIDAQAVQYGTTTQKSDYDNAISTLTAYLNTLNTPVAWNNKNGDTTITGTTFRGYFNSVYTTRQTLLNAIYTTAKSLADGAQGTANTALTGVNSNQPLVNNPYFSTGDLTGWQSDHGTVAFQSGTNGPASGSSAYAIRTGSSGTPAEALRNTAKIPVYPGAVVKAQCAIRGIGTPNGTAGVRISWRDASDTELSNTQGNTTTGNATNGSYVTGTTPAGAMFAHVECGFYNHTAGQYTVDNFWAAPLADSMDQVPDGATRFGAAEAGADKTSGKPLSSLSGRTMDYIGDSATRFAAAQAGADKTGSNPQGSTWLTDSANMARGGDSITRFGGRTLDNVGDSASRFAAAETGADKTAGKSLTVLTDRNLDNVTDSATYLRTIQQSQAAGALSVDNATFQLGNATGWTATNASAYAQSASPAPAIGSQYIVVKATAANGFIATNRKYACNPGDDIAVGGLAYAANGTALIAASFYTAAGAYISAASAGTAAAAWTPVSTHGKFPANAAYFVLVCQQATSGAFGLFNYVWCSVNDIRVAGSGATVGDQRNLLLQTWGGMRSVLSNSPISFSISGTTVSFSVAAVTLQGAGSSLPYAASSGSVTQAAGTTVTYFLYYIDNAQAGGSLPLNITTNPGGPASWPNGMLLGTAQVTVASGGGGTSGTGGGGGGYCVADDMYIGAGRLAGDAQIGDPFDCIDLPTAAGKHVRALQGVSRGMEECVRMITSDGCALVCSLSTPFDLPDGRGTTAPRMLGEQVITDLGTATVISLALVGPKHVTRAHLGGVSYAAGADPQRRIYSHNAGVSKP